MNYNSYKIRLPLRCIKFHINFVINFVVDKAIWPMVQYKLLMRSNASQAAVAQSVERRIGSAEVTGPIPVSSFKKPLRNQGLFTFLWG